MMTLTFTELAVLITVCVLAGYAYGGIERNARRFKARLDNQPTDGGLDG